MAKSKPKRPTRKKAGGRKSLLTPRIITDIARAIRAGCFAHVAAEAAGIGERTYHRWLARGEDPNGGRLYRQFWQEVCKAKAQARKVAEARVFKENPVFWLKSGPGRPDWHERSEPLPETAPPAPGPTQADIDKTRRGALRILEEIGLIKILSPDLQPDDDTPEEVCSEPLGLVIAGTP